MAHTHAGRLERWLGTAEVERISAATRHWYGPPIPVAGVPGRVYAMPGGDFCGPIRGGYYATLWDVVRDRLRRAMHTWARHQRVTCNTGFASLSDLISEATAGGKSRYFAYQKVGTTGVVAATNSLFRVGNQPSAGAAAAAAPGGTVPNDASVGAFPFGNPTNPDTQHLVRWDGTASVVANTLLLYDRIFAVLKAMASTATQAVTGVPTRYQSTTPGAVDSAEGNFLFVECGTALAATAHNWTVCLYTDQSGNAGATLPSLVGNSANIANRLDHPVSQWFAPLAAGDSGIKALTQMQCSASVATGTIDFVIGHPLAFMPHPVANQMWVLDGINSAFNLTRIFDDACLAFLEITKPATGACTYSGLVQTVAG